MAVSLETTIKRFIGLSTDVKPTGALVPVGSTYFEYDTKCVYITYDGTNYTLLDLDYGLVFGGTCNAAMIASTTTVACADLAGYGNDYFNQKFYIQVIKNTNSIGAAPDGEIRQITDYVDATGTFTTDAFSANVEASDEIYILHSSIMIILSDLPSVGEWVLGDYDNFDVADADGDNDRWDIGYISGAAGGSADIDTTANDKYTVLAGYNIAGAERYSGYKAIPFYADYMKVTTDLDCTFGATDSATPKAVGIALSKGVAWDANNYIVIERQVGTGVDRIQMRSSLNGGAEVTTNVAITDDSIALKIERLDETYAGYYSTVQSGSGVEDWIKIGEIEDPNNYMTNQYTYYMHAFNGAAGDATETAQGDFGLFKFWLGTGGGAQYIVGDYDSSWVTSDIDGNVFERQEALQKAVNVTDAGVLTGFEEDGTGANLFNTLVAVQGISDGVGTTATFVDSARTEGADYWNGNLIVSLTGGAAGQIRTIVDDDGAGTLTVEPLLIAAPGTAIAYVILKQKNADWIVGANSADNAFDSSAVVANSNGSVLERLEYLQTAIVSDFGGLFFAGSVSSVEGGSETTVFYATGLSGYGDDNFITNYYIQFVNTTDDLAPINEVRQITDYVSTTGQFTVAPAFSADVTTSDKFIVLHETLIINGRDDADNAFASTNVIANADGSIIEREQYIQTDVASLLADVGDASGSTLTSLLGIVGNPGVDSISTVGGQLATAAHAGVVDNATSLMGYIKQLVTSSGGGAGATGSFYEQADVAFTDNAIAGGETDVFDLNTADTRFVVRSLTLKSVNPGIDKVIVRLRKLVNDISTVVATFNIDSTNYTTYFNLMDMFGESPIAGDDLHVTIQTDANTYAVTGQYSFGKTNN